MYEAMVCDERVSHVNRPFLETTRVELKSVGALGGSKCRKSWLCFPEGVPHVFTNQTFLPIRHGRSGFSIVLNLLPASYAESKKLKTIFF